MKITTRQAAVEDPATLALYRTFDATLLRALRAAFLVDLEHGADPTFGGGRLALIERVLREQEPR
jgi:hypothetical protein